VRGWNGTLTLENGRVVLARGLRGTLVRGRQEPALEVPVERVGVVRFAPSRGLVGYVQVLERDAAAVERDYLSTIRDPRTVTFMTRSGRWRRLAEAIAAQSGAALDVSRAQPYRSAIRGRAAK